MLKLRPCPHDLEVDRRRAEPHHEPQAGSAAAAAWNGEGVCCSFLPGLRIEASRLAMAKRALLLLLSFAASNGGASLWEGRAGSEDTLMCRFRRIVPAPAPATYPAPVLLRLRGGREKEQARWEEDNERLAREYMARVRNKGHGMHADDEPPAIGVPEQVADEEADSARRSMVRDGLRD